MMLWEVIAVCSETHSKGIITLCGQKVLFLFVKTCGKGVMTWRPAGRRKRGRAKLTWAEGIRGLMGEKGLMEEDWNDRSNWRKGII